MPHTGRKALIDQLIREIADVVTARREVSVLVAAALLASSSPDLLADAMEASTTTADRQFVAIAIAHLAGDHDRVGTLARDHLVDHAGRPLLVWIVSQSPETTTTQGAHP